MAKTKKQKSPKKIKRKTLLAKKRKALKLNKLSKKETAPKRQTLEEALLWAEKKLKKYQTIKSLRISPRKTLYNLPITKALNFVSEKKETPPRGYTTKPTVKTEIKIIRDNSYLHKKSPYIIDLKKTSSAEQPLLSKNASPLTGNLNKKGIFWPKIKLPAASVTKDHLKTWEEPIKKELLIVNLFELVGLGFYKIFRGFIYLAKTLTAAFRFLGNFFFPPAVKKNARGYLATAGSILKIIGGIIAAPFIFCAWFFKQINNRLLALEIVPPEGWGRKLISFCLLGIMIVLPLRGIAYYESLKETKGKILGISSEALAHLEGGKNESFKNPGQAGEEFALALKNFETVRQELGGLNSALNAMANILPVDNQITAGAKLIKAGENIAAAGKILTNVFSSLEKKPGLHLTQKLSLLDSSIKKSLPLLEEAGLNISEIKSETIPLEYRETFKLTQKSLPLLIVNIKNFTKFSDALLRVLGHEEGKRYLIFFQNNAELRPTGGFLGSFALLDLDRGEIKKLKIPGGGTYDMNGGLKEFVLAPEPLHLVNTRWQFQDSNWFADFPTSAQKMMWFYEKSGGPTIDGVIAITPSVVEKLLEITGPISMESEYGATINSGNFWRIAQKEAEKKFAETAKSKKIIGDLTGELLEKILQSDQGQYLRMLRIINEALDEKDIQLYFNEPQLEKLVDNLGWSGSLQTAPCDYLAVVHTNIAGGKSDRVIDEEISLSTEINKNGEIINTVKITKTHRGAEGEEFVGTKNIDYLKIYVPQGSELLAVEGQSKPENELFEKPADNLISDPDLQKIIGPAAIDKATGTEITTEFGKTAFANWLQVKPGHSRSLTFKYRLPFVLKSKGQNKSFLSFLKDSKAEKYLYTLLIQKQAGTNGHFSQTIKLPNNLKMFWKYPHALQVAADDIWKASFPLSTDRVTAFILQK
ncbi:MAG: DUF4012 domain-containing protein [Patescibacteria group bacterium]|nr:DUF4012 domain-containing protein [Patescibacteria group bacterium]MDD5490975.1 DUF4012 domain-containing protein [Patescibacteria group bacterium]